ncbi:MAG: protein phosphatase [Modestobacter sp.]|nr:protein phosphatase [Modestobacter sp.]
MCLTAHTLPYRPGRAAHGPTVVGVGEVRDPATPGLLVLPSGRAVRGRGLRQALPGGPEPGYGVYLLGRAPHLPWESRWVRWPDFRLPADPADLREALTEVLHRAAAERVEVACDGGTGRTGTALACLAVLDGVPAAEAVGYVRERYRPRAVETRAQRSFVAWFDPAG